MFCFLTVDEVDDTEIPGEEFTLGVLAATQADFNAHAAWDRRAINIHLANNDPETLSHFADRFCLAISAIKRP